MFIERIRIANFKSFKDAELRPEGLTTLVGSNNAGKTNFVLAMKFLSEVYRHGLEMALARAGGIESILRHTAQRSALTIAFDVTIRLDGAELHSMFCSRRFVGVTLSDLRLGQAKEFRVRHSFKCRASEDAFRADYHVLHEHLEVDCSFAGRGEGAGATDRSHLAMARDAAGRVVVEDLQEPRRGMSRGLFDELLEPHGYKGPGAGPTCLSPARHELMVAEPGLREFLSMHQPGSIGWLGVHRCLPESIRVPAVATPNPELGILGDNLPSMVDWLRRKHPDIWRQVLSEMTDIVPKLRDIGVVHTVTKRLSLFFKEEGFDRAWDGEEVSEGTVRLLAILVACADPRVAAVVIDEPENSLHPWMIHELGRRLRRLAKKKTVILTTQSPVVMDLLYPKEVWVVSRRKGATSIRNLVELDRSVDQHWSDGVAKLSELLDMGVVPQAVPGGGEG